MPDIVNFTLVGAGYFSTAISNLALCSRTQLSYMETVFSIWVLLSSLIRCLAYMLTHFSHIRFFATLWIVDLQAPLSMGFSRQDY